MDRALYIGMNGASQTMRAQTVTTNNLANAHTTGFRADLAAFKSMPVAGPTYGSRIYATVEPNGVDFKAGINLTTGRELDVAVKGDGFIGVQTPDGGEAYTRNGNMYVNSVGQLLTGSGNPVLGNSGPIVIPPFEKLDIGGDGSITIRPVGQDAASLAIVDRIRLVNPAKEELRKNDDGLFVSDTGIDAIPDASVQLVSGVLEGSNVNSVEAMVTMMDLSRHFEMQVKVMRTVEENERASNDLLSIR